MSYWNEDTTLEAIEEYAEGMDWISSEEELSDLFDEHVAPNIVEAYGEDDTVAMNEEFNNWTDALCKGGEIHEVQYNNYCYVGKYSD